MNTLSHRRGRGVRPKILARPIFLTSVKQKLREFFVIRNVNVGIRLVVPQNNIVGRSQLLNQTLLEQQCLGLTFSYVDLNAGYFCDQRHSLRLETASSKIALYTVSQIFSFSDIENVIRRIKHLINTRLRCERCQKALSVKLHF